MSSRPLIEKACYGVAGLGALTPLYVLWPGAEERLARQTIRWAPRWERNVSHFVRPAERVAVRAEPPANKFAHRIDAMPLERLAKRIDSRLKKEFERWWNIKPSQ